MTLLERMLADADEFFTSPVGVALAKSPLTSPMFPVHRVADDDGVALWHFHRFVRGAADDHAIAGWRAVMDGRRRAARKAARQLEVAIAAVNGKENN